VGDRLLDGLNSLEEYHLILGDVLGLGLDVGMEVMLPKSSMEQKIVEFY
jgi:4-aminobutyrate aminotransferase-like enzyme